MPRNVGNGSRGIGRCWCSARIVGSLLVLSFACRGEDGVGGLAFVDD